MKQRREGGIGIEVYGGREGRRERGRDCKKKGMKKGSNE